MKKFLLVSTIVIAIFILCVAVKSFFNYAQDFTLVLSNSVSSDFLTEKNAVPFLDVPENPDFINSALKISRQLTQDSPFEKSSEKELAESYLLRNAFSSFYPYYVTKIKVETAVYEKLDWICSAVSSFNETQLQNYFSSNSEYIENHFGITSFEDFYDFIQSLSPLKESNVLSCSVSKNSIYYSNGLYFRILIQTKSEDFFYLNVCSLETLNRKDQNSIKVKFSGSGGGVS